MLQCWSESAKSRPSFAELYETLDKMLSSETATVQDTLITSYLRHRIWHKQGFTIPELF